MGNNYILDANILFSGLLSKKVIYRKLFEENIFYTPDFALSELEKYRETILKKSKTNVDDLKSFTIFIFSKIIVVPDFIISNDSLESAIELCQSIDVKDSVYVALAIELNHSLITRDKFLYKGLITKGFHNVILFDDFISQSDSL